MKRLAIILMLLASVAYGASDYLHVTVAGAGNNDGQTWANAFSLSDFITDVNDNSEAGDVYYIKSGTYTMAAGEPIYITTTDHDGTAQAPISLIGVLSTTTNEDGAIDGDDYAYGTDRPYFDCSTNTEEFRVSDYWIFSNLSFLTNSGSGIIGYVSQLFVNCKAYNNKNTANYPAFSLRGTGAGAFSCEAYSDSGISLDLSGASHTVANCYLHDSTQAIKINSTNLIFIGML